MAVVTTSRSKPQPRDSSQTLSSESQLRERVQRAVQQSRYLELRRISCKYHEGVVFLDGQVASFYLKQVAQTIVLQVDGVEELVNRLRVVYPKR